jgi:hypothetical protein
MTKGEERRDASAVVVSVANVETLAVDDFEIFTRPVVVGGCVFYASGECALSSVSDNLGGTDEGHSQAASHWAR